MPKNDLEVEAPLDAEDWEIAFAVYEGNPGSVLTLAHHLISLRSYLNGEPKNIPEAIAAIDRAVDSLYEHSEFRSVGHEMFRAAVEGRLTTEQENRLHEL